MEPVIQLEDVSFTYPNGFTALKHLNIDVAKNEFLAIIGQNGAGKSTLLKNMTGLLKPSEGNIWIDQKNTRDISIAKLSQTLGFVLQNPDRQLFADTVYEEVAFGPQNLKLDQAEIEERTEEALRLAGLLELKDKFPPALSAGERAKVVIASVAAMRPDIIVLDEPTTGQDHRGCHQIMDIAQTFHAAGHTVIMVTHNMALVAEFAKRTIVFCQGEVLLDDTTERVFSQPDILKKSYILPPQITRLSLQLQGLLGTHKVFLNAQDMARCIDDHLRAGQA